MRLADLTDGTDFVPSALRAGSAWRETCARAVCAVLVLLLPGAARAETFLVTPDSGGDGVMACADDTAAPKTNCSFEEALEVAEASAEDDTITLAAGSGGNYTSSGQASPGPFSFSSVDGTSLTIEGAGMGQTILDGGGVSAVLAAWVSMAGDLTIRDLSIRQGVAAPSGFTAGLQASADSGRLELVRVEVLDNVGGTKGGGAHLFVNSGELVVEDSLIADNVGAAGSASGISLLSNTTAVMTFENNVVRDNVSSTAQTGGVSLSNDSGGATMTVVGNEVRGNSGVGVGGIAVAVHFSTGPLSFANNVIASNQSTMATDLYRAGGFMLLSDTSSQVTVDFVNNTVVGNAAQNSAAGGVYIYHGVTAGGSYATSHISNNIVYGNTTVGDAVDDILLRANTGTSPSFELAHNIASEVCFSNDGTSFTCDLASVPIVSVTGASAADPMLADPSGGEFALLASSPAIDVGDNAAPGLPATDFLGNVRVVGDAVDLGALEAQPKLSVKPASLDFGEVAVGQDAVGTVTFSNRGAGAVAVSSPSLTKATPFSLDADSGKDACGSGDFVLAGEQSCTMALVFEPDAPGDFDAVLEVLSDDPKSPKTSLSLSGTAKRAPAAGGEPDAGPGADAGAAGDAGRPAKGDSGSDAEDAATGSDGAARDDGDAGPDDAGTGAGEAASGCGCDVPGGAAREPGRGLAGFALAALWCVRRARSAAIRRVAVSWSRRAGPGR